MHEEERALIEYLASLRFEDLPAKVVEAARLRLLDQVGVTLAGARESAARIAVDYVLGESGPPDALVFGTAVRTGAERAALANGIMGHVLELDDGNRFAMGHPGVVVVPAALALAEATHASGARLITSIVAGYELFVRLGSAVNPGHYKRGFHTTGTVGALAAATAAAKVLDLGFEAFASSLGLAGSMASGLFEFLADGTMTKQLHAGNAAASGVRSGRMAQLGFSGPRTVIQGEHGFMAAMCDEVTPGRLTADLGGTSAVLQCYVKLHACCRHIHPVVDAIQTLRSRSGVEVRDVARIEVATYAFAARLDGVDINNALAARFSVPYCAAVTLLEGSCGLRQFRTELLTDALVRATMAKVSVKTDRGLDAAVPDVRGCRVKATLHDGTTFSEEVLLPLGEPERPVGQQVLERKYRDGVAGVLQPAAIEDSLQLLAASDMLADVTELTAVLAAGLSHGR